MPIYEYQSAEYEKGCQKCRKGFECIQMFSETPVSKCPYCGARVKRIISRCHAAVVETAQEYKGVQEKVSEYEKRGMYSHAAELADKYSHQTEDSLLRERALEDYKKAGYNLDSSLDEDK